MLANVEVLPEGDYHSDEMIHKNVQQLLLESKIDEAWKLLIK
jgi:hypothetical protein